MLPDDLLEEQFDQLVAELGAPVRSDLPGLQRRIDRRRHRHLVIGSSVAVGLVLVLLVGTVWARSGSPRRVDTYQPSVETPPGGDAYLRCKADTLLAGDLVAAAYPATVVQARDLTARSVAGVSSSALEGRPDDEQVVVCYANGPINRAWYPGIALTALSRQDAILLGDGQVVTFGLHPDGTSLESATTPPAGTMGTLEGRLLPVSDTTHGVLRQVSGPISGVVTLQRVDDPSMVIGLDVPTGGTFAVGLRPGTYTVVGTSTTVDAGGTTCRTQVLPVEVTLRAQLTMDLSCQIR